jgi:hypothetical protein
VLVLDEVRNGVPESLALAWHTPGQIRPKDDGKSGIMAGELAKMMFAIPGVKGIEFGAGFRAAGMKGSDMIIAINSDPNAPIFDVAHYGTTCDALKLMPALVEKLSK